MDYNALIVQLLCEQQQAIQQLRAENERLRQALAETEASAG